MGMQLAAFGCLRQGQVAGLCDRPRGPVEEANDLVGRERVSPPLELLMLAQKRCLAATGNKAFALAFRAGIEGAESTEIAVGSGFKNEHINLVGRDPDAPPLHQFSDRSGALPAQGIQVRQVGEPERQIEVLALMPELDPRAPVRA